MGSLSFLFPDDFEGNANISLAIKSASTVLFLLQFFVMLVFVFPIRLVLTVIFLLSAGFVAKIAVAYHPLDAKYRMSLWRRYASRFPSSVASHSRFNMMSVSLQTPQDPGDHPRPAALLFVRYSLRPRDR